MLVTEMEAPPGLDSVTGCDALVIPTCCEVKVRLLGDAARVTTTPVPERLTVVAVDDAFEAMVKEPEAGPADCGLKVTLMVQLEPADKTTPQELVWRKPIGVVTLMIVKSPIPGLEKVTGCELLAEPRV